RLLRDVVGSLVIVRMNIQAQRSIDPSFVRVLQDRELRGVARQQSASAAEPVNENETVDFLNVQQWRRRLPDGGAVVDEFLGHAPISASACSSQYVMPISRYIVVAVVRCSCPCSRFAVRR